MPSPYFSPEHDELRRRIRAFVESEISPHVATWEARGEIPREIFRRMGERGLLGLRFPKEYGGGGGDHFTAVVMAEELARCGAGSLPMAVAVQTEMATPPILKFGTEEQKQRYLIPALRGEKIGALAITEPGAGSDVASLRTTAKREGDGYRISGSKTFITNGVAADFVLVVTRTDPGAGHRGFSLFLVDRGTPGFHVARKLDKVGMRASDTAELFFDNCRVPADALLGEEHRGFFHLMWELQGERLIAAVGAVAFAQLASDLAIDHATRREQFGRPIVTFQTIRHRLARMAAQVEAVRRFTYATVRRCDLGEYPVVEISMVKLAAARTACRVIDDALQVFGGHGFASDATIERLWRDARLYRIGAGTDEIMLEIIAKERFDKAERRAAVEPWPFSDEHGTFRRTVRSFVEREIVPHVEEWERGEAIPRALFQKMAEAGYLGIGCGEAYGGSDAGPLYEAIFHEEISRCGSGGVAAAVGAHAGVAARLIARLGTEEQKQRYLVPAIRGELIGALAVTEPGAGSDAAGIAASARRESVSSSAEPGGQEADAYVLSGTKTFVTNGASADFFVVAARTAPDAGPRGISLLIVDRNAAGRKGEGGDAAGRSAVARSTSEGNMAGMSAVGMDRSGSVAVRRMSHLGWRASGTAELRFEASAVPASNLLGEVNRGFYHLMENAQWERLLVALQAVVTAEVALDQSVSYARARVQFERPLVEFQALRHRLAECAAETEVARALTYHVLWLYDQGEECVKEAAMAKLVATETACRVTDEALQIHGGYGYVMEYPIQRLWRDARLGRIGGGTSEIMAEVIADRLGLPRERPAR